MDKTNDAGNGFIFIPHPDLLEDFLKYLKIMPGVQNLRDPKRKIKRLKQKLEKYFSKPNS